MRRQFTDMMRPTSVSNCSAQQTK